MKTWIGLIAIALIAAQPAHAADSGAYAVTGKFQLGGVGGWDDLNVDAEHHLLYLSRADRVWVVDTASGARVAEILDTPGVHGIALAPELGRGFISCGKANLVKVFDLKTNQVIDSIPTGQGPDAILYDAGTQRVFVFNGHGKSASVIDAKTNAVIGTIALGGKPEFARADGLGHVYVNIEDTSELLALDAQALKILSRWPLAPCQEPSGLAFDVAHRRLFPVCSNRLMQVVNADSGKIVSTLPIGEGVDGAAFDPGSGRVFSSNGDGTLTVVDEKDPDHYSVAQTLPTQAGARTVTLDAVTHRLYLPTALRGPVPAATTAEPRLRAPIVPDTFVVLVVEPQKQP
jgi:YVTN family beta-propeller protein